MNFRSPTLERQIERQQSIIADSETVLSQLDQQVATLIEYDRIRGPSGSIAVRQSQSEERQSLNEAIDNAYIRIEEIQTESHAASTRKTGNRGRSWSSKIYC